MHGPCRCFMTGLQTGTAETVTVLLNVHKTYWTISLVKSLITDFPTSSVKAKWGSISPLWYPTTSAGHAKGDAIKETECSKFFHCNEMMFHEFFIPVTVLIASCTLRGSERMWTIPKNSEGRMKM